MEKDTHHDDTETTQERVYKSLPKKYTIRHVTYSCETLATNVLEANRIAHLLCNQDGFGTIKSDGLTSSPTTEPISCAVRVATEVTATRRGCVQAMTLPPEDHPDS
jgi:hypothetical protein